MVLLDFIDLRDDVEIINLCSDEEDVEESHNASTHSNSAQHQATLHDVQAVFAAEGEGREQVSAQHQATLHDVQAVFAAEGEGREEVSGQHQATFHDVQAVFATEGEGREEVTESGNPEEATASSSITEKESGNPEEATASQTCAHTPAAVTLPGPSTVSPKALTFEACDAKPARVKARRRRKLFHADTPWRSPRLEGKRKGRRRSAEEAAVELKRSRMLYEEENTSARSQRKSKLVGTQCGICRESPLIPQN